MPRCLLASAVLVLEVMSPERALAAPCRVHLRQSAPHEWLEAAGRLQNALDANSGDCARVDIAIEDGTARVVYESTDGRRAVRDVPTPADLPSTVDALRVTGPRGIPTTAARPEPALHPPADRGSRPSTHHPPAPETDGLLTRFGLGAGVRGGDERLFSPTLDGFASLGVARWDIGIGGRWEMAYRQIGDELHRGALGSGLAAGVLVDRRQRFGQFDGIAGIDLMLASIDQEASERSRAGESVAHSEARVGAYLSAVFPATSRMRARAGLGAELVPLRWGSAVRDSRGGPVLPWWAASVTLGVELESR